MKIVPKIETKQPVRPDHAIKDSLKRLSDEDLKYVYTRFTHRTGADLSEALGFIENRVPEIQKLFSATQSSSEVYDLADLMKYYCQDESRRRSANRNGVMSA